MTDLHWPCLCPVPTKASLHLAWGQSSPIPGSHWRKIRSVTRTCGVPHREILYQTVLPVLWVFPVLVELRQQGRGNTCHEPFLTLPLGVVCRNGEANPLGIKMLTSPHGGDRQVQPTWRARITTQGECKYELKTQLSSVCMSHWPYCCPGGRHQPCRVSTAHRACGHKDKVRRRRNLQQREKLNALMLPCKLSIGRSNTRNALNNLLSNWLRRLLLPWKQISFFQKLPTNIRHLDCQREKKKQEWYSMLLCFHRYWRAPYIKLGKFLL